MWQDPSPCGGELHMWALSRAVFRERVRALAEPDPDPYPGLSPLNTYIRIMHSHTLVLMHSQLSLFELH